MVCRAPHEPKRRHPLKQWRGRFAVGTVFSFSDWRVALRRLARPHGGVEPVGAHEVGMGAAFDDAPLIQHDDFVGIELKHVFRPWPGRPRC